MKLTKTLKDKIITYFELGLTPGDISELTGIDLFDFCEICEADIDIKTAKRSGSKTSNQKVVEALLKSAVGFESKETTVDKKYGQDGKKVIFKSVSETTKQTPPNITAIKYWLQNRSKEWAEGIKEAERELNISISVDGKDIIVKNNNNNNNNNDNE